jgi:hypothetical protein
MERQQFLHNIRVLRHRGQSIRTIAAELGVNRGRVARALKVLKRLPAQPPLTWPVGRTRQEG